MTVSLPGGKQYCNSIVGFIPTSIFKSFLLEIRYIVGSDQFVWKMEPWKKGH